MDVRLWGPHAWEFFHAVTFAFPDEPTPEDQMSMVQFIYSLRHLLPCKRCREHFANLLREFPPDTHVMSRKDISRWMVDAHNKVNARLGKPTMSYEHAQAKYEAMRGTCRVEVNPNSERAVARVRTHKLMFRNLLLLLAIVCLLIAGGMLAKSYLIKGKLRRRRVTMKRK